MRQNAIIPLLFIIGAIALLMTVGSKQDMQKALPLPNGGGAFALWGFDEGSLVDELIDNLGENLGLASSEKSTSSQFVSSFMDFDFVFNVKNYRALDDDNLADADNIRR